MADYPAAFPPPVVMDRPRTEDVRKKDWQPFVLIGSSPTQIAILPPASPFNDLPFNMPIARKHL